MAIYVGSFPLLVQLAGDLFPALGSGDLARVLQLIGLALLIFAVQKIAQFGQDSLLAGPALLVSQDLRRDLFRRLQTVELGACLLYTSPSPRDLSTSRMPSSA